MIDWEEKKKTAGSSPFYLGFEIWRLLPERLSPSPTAPCPSSGFPPHWHVISLQSGRPSRVSVMTRALPNAATWCILCHVRAGEIRLLRCVFSVHYLSAASPAMSQPFSRVHSLFKSCAPEWRKTEESLRLAESAPSRNLVASRFASKIQPALRN